MKVNNSLSSTTSFGIGMDGGDGTISDVSKSFTDIFFGESIMT